MLLGVGVGGSKGVAYRVTLFAPVDGRQNELLHQVPSGTIILKNCRLKIPFW